MQAIYYPILPVWFYYAFKARSLFFFRAANPSIKNGGMSMESKKEIYDIMPEQFIPKTILIKKGTSLKNMLDLADKAEIRFPMIAKPDIGMKAFGVVQVKNNKELKDYSQKIGHDFLLQELITFPNEMGIFYTRIPGEPRGKITGLVAKEFLTIEGNGKDSILTLIKQNKRSNLQLSALKKLHGDYLKTILSPGEKFILVPFGSHTRGSKFTDISDRLNEQLFQTIDRICLQIPGFYFGRLDIRYASFNDLCEGKNFSIIELNGTGSDPTHIYDPAHSIFFAWKEIIRHWKLLYRISKLNFAKGNPYLSFQEGKEMLRENRILEAQLRLF
jgi:hypothetical protein